MNTIDKIIKLLEESNKSQKDLTDYLNLDKSTFSAWKNGKSQSYNKYLAKISDFLNVSTDYLVSETLELDFIPHEDDDNILKCPVCDYDYVHFYRTISTNFKNFKSNGIALEFLGECGHRFYLVIESYKGNTYVVMTDEDGKIYPVENIPFESVPVSLEHLWNSEEIGNINKKYRILDEYGKKAVNELLNIEYERCNYESKKQLIQLPMAELKASAGTGQWLGDDEYTNRIDVLDTPEARKANIVIEVTGDSMLPKYKNGDKVLVKLQPVIEKGEIGIFVIDNCGYIKKLGDKELISINPEYDNIPFTEYSNALCVGKVLGKAEIYC